jgi:lipoprotein-anchoring transpeptidase ErfK/SrfK
MIESSSEGVMSIKSVFTLTALIAAAALSCGAAQAQQRLAYNAASAPQYAPVDQSQTDEDAQLDPRFQRQVVDYLSNEAPGTIVIDTPHTFLYYVLGGGKAMRYGIGVGREGFTWSGVKQVARKAEWPDWYPPSEMIGRQPYLPRMTAGGPGNPLGARAMYLGTSEYRIHGTNDPTTIGKTVSSGCIRLTNEDVIDLYNRVQIGAKVVVLPQQNNPATVAQAPAPAPVRQMKAQQVSMTSSYASAPVSGAQRTWSNIRPAGIY